MQKRSLVLCALIVLVAAAAFPLSANDSYTVFTYDMAQPFGELKDFTSEFSWRGWSLLGSVKYHYAFGTKDYRATSYLGINAGFVSGI